MNVGGRIFKAKIINPISDSKAEFFNPGYLVILGDKIKELSKKDPTTKYPKAEMIDLEEKLMLPGLIDTHLHLPQFSFLGIGDQELLKWLNKYTFPEEAKFEKPKYAQKVSEQFFDELIANGTTTASIYVTVHEEATDIAFTVAEQKGLRAYIGKVMMDQNSPPNLQEDTKESVEASVKLFDKWDGHDNGRLRYIFTPRFAPTCSKDLMAEVGRIAKKRNAYVQTHLSENKGELGWVKELFPESANYTEVYNSVGLLGKRVIMAHCIYLSKDEVKLLKGTGTKVSHCPYSNRFLRSGTMPYFPWKDSKLAIGLGSDVAGGPCISMFRQMGEAIMTSNDALQKDEKIGRVMNPVGALYLATLGGAKVLGLDKVIGNFKPRKEADFIIVNPLLSDPMKGEGSYNNLEHILSRLCFNAEKESVEGVYIRGKQIYSAKKI